MFFLDGIKEEDKKEILGCLDELEAISQREAERNGWNKEEEDSPLSITIKPEALDTSKMQTGDGSKQYRPKTLDDYVGQKEAKIELLNEIHGCKANNEPFSHTFISAPAGHGKTLLAEIIANILDKKVVFTTGGQLKSEQLFVDKINECEGGLIIIDEANKLPDKVGFFMLPTIEKFEVDGKSLIPFTVIFMTTHKGDIAKNLDALIQRCNLQLELNHYNQEELITILKGYKDKQYPTKRVPDEIYTAIAKNCRATPRLARTLLRKYVFSGNWEQVLEMNKIVKDGLTDVDVKVLKYINSNGGASKGSIASYLRVKPSTYEFEIETYLIHKELLEVKNKRKITPQGIQFLKEI